MQGPILTTREAADFDLIEADDEFLTSRIHWALLKAKRDVFLGAGSKSTLAREESLKSLVNAVAEQFRDKVLLKRDYGNVAHSIDQGPGAPHRAASNCNADPKPL